MEENTPNDPSEAEKTWLDQLPVNFKKKFWNPEKIISVSAFVVSIATLLALMYQIRLSGEQNELARRQQELVRKQQYASVLPYLELRVGTNNGNRLFELVISNNGVGPAFIEEIRTVYDDQIYIGSPYLFYRTVIMQEEKDTITLGYKSILKGSVIPAEEDIYMLMAYNYSSSPEDRDTLVKWFGRSSRETPELARVEVVYASVYGERWITRGIANGPEAIPSENEE